MQNKTTTADELSTWAEDMPDFGPDTKILSGAESRAALADLFDRPPADEADVTRRLRGRGRPALNVTSQPGRTAKQLHVRIGDDLDHLVRVHLEHNSALKNESELVRTALSEYLQNHKISA